MRRSTIFLAIAVLGATAGLAVPALAGPQDNSVSLGMQLEPPTLDPTAGAAAAIDEVTYANIFQGLTRFEEDGTVVPDLATSWDVTEDGLTYTFHLHSGVTFRDGTKMTADDVRFSLDRARAPDSANAQKGLFEAISDVTVIDPLTVRVTLKEPDGSLLFNLAWGDAAIVSPKTAANNATDPVGTGPFMLKDWVKGDHITLVRRPDYWGTPARLDSVTFKFISDPSAAFAAMMSGDLDAYPAYPAPENIDQFKADPRFKVVVGSTQGETILAMNNARKPFDDIKVREAVVHAIDRKAVIDGAMYGYGTPIGTHFAPQNPAYVDLTGLSKYDPELSKKLLREAGHPEGFKTTLKLPPPSYARRGGEIIAAELRKVGIDAQIINIEWSQWLQNVFKNKDYGLTIVAHTEPMDIGIYGRDDYYFNYHSVAFRKIMDELTKTSDAEKRIELLHAAQERIAKDYVNAFLFEYPKLSVARAGLVGLWKDQPTQATDMTAVHWEK